MPIEGLEIHHVGYMVKNIKKAAAAFHDLDYTDISEVVHDDYRKIDILFLSKNGYCVELVSPTDRTTKIAELTKRIGNSPYHICYKCKNIEETCAKLSDAGYVLCDELHEAVALDDHRVCFYIHPFLGMIELLEE